jgi:hypothetical protein
MHSFQPSRGRILFEVFCAFGIVASCVGAWKQTGASALLAAASFAGLYGFVRLLDLAAPRQAEVIEPQRIEFEPEVEADLPAYPGVVVPIAAPDQRPDIGEQRVVEAAVDEAELVEPPAPRAKEPRQAKAPRKSGGRRSKAPKEAKVTELAPPAEPEIPEPVFHEEVDAFEPGPHDEVAHIPPAPLFEPAPYVHVRQQRAAFGRKAR